MKVDGERNCNLQALEWHTTPSSSTECFSQHFILKELEVISQKKVP